MPRDYEGKTYYYANEVTEMLRNKLPPPKLEELTEKMNALQRIFNSGGSLSARDIRHKVALFNAKGEVSDCYELNNKVVSNFQH